MGNQREKRRFSLINNMIFLSCKQKKFCLSLGFGSNFPIIQLFIFLHHHGDSQSQISISVAVLGYVISREITVKRYNILSIQIEICFSCRLVIFRANLYWTSLLVN